MILFNIKPGSELTVRLLHNLFCLNYFTYYYGTNDQANQKEFIMTELIEFKLNGKTVKLKADGERMLLWVLRTDFGMTGTKYGCGEGFCGASLCCRPVAGSRQ
jgi:hypothetical protein